MLIKIKPLAMNFKQVVFLKLLGLFLNTESKFPAEYVEVKFR
jgi:hypothetical protein